MVPTKCDQIITGLIFKKKEKHGVILFENRNVSN